MTCKTIGMTASTSNTCIQRLGISKTKHPMIHVVSRRPDENMSMGAVSDPTAGLASDLPPLKGA